MTSGDEEELSAVPPVFAEWVEGASAEQRDAHYRAQRWAHVLAWQVDRLYDARRQALESNERVRAAGYYPDDARWPFFENDAEAHFALVAARQLLRALRAFDGNDRLPATLDAEQLRLVRDGLEHWDEPGGRAATALAALGVEANAHEWTRTGPGRLGGLVLDAVLKEWASDVYAELARWDPYNGWA